MAPRARAKGSEPRILPASLDRAAGGGRRACRCRAMQIACIELRGLQRFDSQRLQGKAGRPKGDPARAACETPRAERRGSCKSCLYSQTAQKAAVGLRLCAREWQASRAANAACTRGEHSTAVVDCQRRNASHKVVIEFTPLRPGPEKVRVRAGGWKTKGWQVHP